jgi:FkbM family methyltransferase
MSSMKTWIQRLMRPLGVEIARLAPEPFAVQRQAVVTANPVILDVGAYVGEVTNHYRLLFPGATIHAFEPFPESFAELERRTKAHGSLTQLHHLAVSDEPGRHVFHANGAAATNSLLPTDERAGSYWKAGLVETERQVEVPVTSLDVFCRQQSIRHVDILKLDIQGGEYLALQGAAGLLSTRSISLVYLEVITAPTYSGQHKLHEYLQLFDNYGYELLDIYHPVRKATQLLQADLLFTAAGQQLLAA